MFGLSDSQMRLVLEMQDKLSPELEKAAKQIKKIDNSAGKAKKSFSDLGAKVKTVAKGVATAVAAVVTAIAAVGIASIKAASDAQETKNKFNVVFSDITAKANDMTQALRSGYGLSRAAAQKFLSDNGDLIEGLGGTQKAALETANTITKFAVDLSSFTNVEVGAVRANKALLSLYTGEREAIKAYGIAINDANLKQFAKDTGRVFKEMTKLEQGTFAVEYAMIQSKNAIGDFDRSSGSLANQMRIAEAKINDFQLALGEKLIPKATEVVSQFAEMATSFLENEDVMRGLEVIIGVVADALSLLIGIVFGTIAALGQIAGAIGMVSTNTGYMVEKFEKSQKVINDQVSEIDDLEKKYNELMGKQNLTNTETEDLKKTTKDLNEILSESKEGFDAEKKSVEETSQAIRQLKVEKQQILLIDLNKLRNAAYQEEVKQLEKLNKLQKQYDNYSTGANGAARLGAAALARQYKDVIEPNRKKLEELRKETGKYEKQASDLLQILTDTFNGVVPPIDKANDAVNNLKEGLNNAGKAADEAGKKIERSLGQAQVDANWAGIKYGGVGQSPYTPIPEKPSTLDQISEGVTGGNPLDFIADSLGGVAGEAIKLTTAMGPLGLVVLAIQQILKGLFSVLGPVINSVIDPLISALRTIGGVLGQLLLPILHQLAPIFSILSQILISSVIPLLELLSGPLALLGFVLQTFIVPIFKALAVILEIVMAPFRFLGDLLTWLGDVIRHVGGVITFWDSSDDTADPGGFSSDAFSGLAGRIQNIMDIGNTPGPGYQDIVANDPTTMAGQGAQYSGGRITNVYVTINTGVFFGPDSERHLGQELKRIIDESEELN